MSNNIGTNIAFFRRKKGLTQKQLADKVNLSPSFISHIENGISNPSNETLEKISNILDVSISNITYDNNINASDLENIRLIDLITKLTISDDLNWLSNGEVYVTEFRGKTYILEYSNFSVFSNVYENISLCIYNTDSKTKDQNRSIFEYEPDYTILCFQYDEINTRLNNLINIIYEKERDKSPIFDIINDLEKYIDNQEE